MASAATTTGCGVTARRERGVDHDVGRQQQLDAALGRFVQIAPAHLDLVLLEQALADLEALWP
jgi:hypothetical protein